VAMEDYVGTLSSKFLALLQFFCFIINVFFLFVANQIVVYI